MAVRDGNSRTVIIGLDGVPFGMIKDLAETGVMPNTAELLSEGVFRKMLSSIPEVSSVAWSSIITGKNPAEHHIFGFTDLQPYSYKMMFPNFSDLRAMPFWEQWEGRSVIMNVPSTYPVHEMNGVHISGFVSVDLEKSVYPRSLVPRLKQMGYRLDVDSEKAHTAMDLFLSDVDKTLDARIEAGRYLLNNQDWQTFMLVFTGTDRLMHFLWTAYEDSNHEHQDRFLQHFSKIDAAVGEICNRISDNDLLVMLSDHGFERLDRDVYINYLLRQQGLLQFKQGHEAELKNISDQTKAFALDPARIYLNLKDKYPCGSINQSDAEELLSKLEHLFRSLEVDGKKVIKEVHRKQRIYSGPYLENAPDMVLISEKGFNLKAHVRADQLANKAVFTGKHTQDNAFLLLRGLTNRNIVPDAPSVMDVKGIMEKGRETN